jgi:2-succinyl-5-enolpyruvyl-6-hydroxy-3-cyclohexene-1-carboxylate synthase
LANSSVVRYAQLFDPLSSVKYNSNRGTSGIDGSTSTAAGAASVASEDWHVLITGDISFFYDSNALWNQHLTPNLRIFMINNDGGGIFKIIPGPNSTQQYESYFVAKHHHSAEHICKAFDIDYYAATEKENLLNQMEDFYTHDETGRPKLMEIFTPSDLNPRVLAAFFEGLKN